MHPEIAAPEGRFRRLARSVRQFVHRTDAPGVAQRDAALALAVRLANAALAYLVQVILARLMGQFEYGVFAYAWVWFMVFAAVSTLGFGDSPLRFIAELRERGEEDHLRGFLRLAPAIVIATALLAGLLLFVAVPLLAPWLGQPYLLPMLLMAMAVPFACLQSYIESVGRSFGWTVRSLLPVYIFRHALLLLFMGAAVFLGFEANAVNAITCLILALASSLIWQAADITVRVRRALSPGPRSYRAREWIGGSVPFAILYGASNLSSFADVLVLSFIISPAEIAIYFAATRIIQIINLVPFAATVGAAHLFAGSHTRGDRAELQRLTRHVAALTLATAALAVVAVLLVGKGLLGLFGSGFEAGYPALAILAVGVLVRVAAGPAEDILNMTGHGNLSARTYVVIMFVNLLLAAALAVPLGIEGAAIASATSLCLRALWLSAAVHRRLGVQSSVLAAPP